MAELAFFFFLVEVIGSPRKIGKEMSTSNKLIVKLILYSFFDKFFFLIVFSLF